MTGNITVIQVYYFVAVLSPQYLQKSINQLDQHWRFGFFLINHGYNSKLTV